MKKRMKMFSALSVAAILMGLIVGGPAAAASMKQAAIDPSDAHEDCAQVNPGQTLYFSFNSPKPVDFRIHYHHERKMVIVMGKKAVSEFKGSYSPKGPHEYCLMWSNTQSVPVVVKYTKSVK